MDAPELPVGMPEVLIERLGIIQPFLIAADTLFLEHGQLAEQIFASLWVGHVAYQLK